MKNNYNYLQDTAFLKYFDNMPIKEQHVKITVLDFMKERPIKSIEGKVIGGNFNIDSSSPVRRTANLSIVADENLYNITDIKSDLSINKKVSIEVGFTNTSDFYLEHDIIWFPMGVYLIFSPSISHALEGITISLTLKDKMCLLNGEAGGSFPAAIDLLNLEYINKNGKTDIMQPNVFETIMELVNHWGGEQIGKIIISDIPSKIYYAYIWNNIEEKCYIKDGVISTESSPGAKEYEFGDLVGLMCTDFVYPSKTFSMNPGDNVCTALSKIVNELGGNFEYFYDVYGNFIFREIKNYLNNSLSTNVWDKISKGDTTPYIIDRSNGKSSYSFEDNKLISSFNNAPQFELIKNDYIVWGKNSSNTVMRYHLAIDQKPIDRNTYKVILQKDSEKDNVYSVIGCPINVNTYNELPDEGLFDFLYYVKDQNQLYYWGYIEEESMEDETPTYHKCKPDILLEDVTATDWRTEIYLNGCSNAPLATNVITIANYYYTELCNEWNNIFLIYKNDEGIYTDKLWLDYYEENGKKGDAYNITYWLDIIDSDAAVGELGISNIGRRTEVMSESNSNCNCVFEPYMPDYYFYEKGDTVALEMLRIQHGDDEIIKIDEDMQYNFRISSTQSCFEQVRNLLYQYTKYNEAINFSSIPIYHLEPNTRITVRDTDSDIYGDYIITGTISIPLNIADEMSITATRALEKI